MILIALIVVPALTAVAVMFARNARQTRNLSAAGMSIQLILSFYLLYLF